LSIADTMFEELVLSTPSVGHTIRARPVRRRFEKRHAFVEHREVASRSTYPPPHGSQSKSSEKANADRGRGSCHQCWTSPSEELAAGGSIRCALASSGRVNKTAIVL
jgi:hypothetical protein